MMGTFHDGARVEQVGDVDLAHLEIVVASLLGERATFDVTFVDARGGGGSTHRLGPASPARFHYDDPHATEAIDDDRVAIMRMSAASAAGLLVPRAAHAG